jgi:hypothetical protein
MNAFTPGLTTEGRKTRIGHNVTSRVGPAFPHSRPIRGFLPLVVSPGVTRPRAILLTAR